MTSGSPSPALPPVRLIVAAATDAARHLLQEAVAESGRGASVSVLFSEAGLDLIDDVWPRTLEESGIRMTLCSRSARLRSVEPTKIPPTITWSSLTNFVADAGPDARLWTVIA